MSDPEPLPAYFIGGPRAGEFMFAAGSPSRLLLPVPVDPLYPWISARDLNPSELLRRQKTDEYDRVRAVILYRYAGRYS